MRIVDSPRRVTSPVLHSGSPDLTGLGCVCVEASFSIPIYWVSYILVVAKEGRAAWPPDLRADWIARSIRWSAIPRHYAGFFVSVSGFGTGAAVRCSPRGAWWVRSARVPFILERADRSAAWSY